MNAFQVSLGMGPAFSRAFECCADYRFGMGSRPVRSNLVGIRSGVPPAADHRPAGRSTLADWMNESSHRILPQVLARDHRDGRQRPPASLLAPDCVFRSPVAYQPYRGADKTELVLATAASVFEDFRYHRRFADGNDVALEFSARIGETELKGIDLVRFDDYGLITEFEVMVRPASGLQALGERWRAASPGAFDVAGGPAARGRRGAGGVAAGCGGMITGGLPQRTPNVLFSARGVYVIAPTPFLDDGRIDNDSVDRMTDFYLAAGVTGITVLGEMGEAPKLEQREALDVAERVIRRSTVPVIVGVSAPGFAATRPLARGRWRRAQRA